MVKKNKYNVINISDFIQNKFLFYNNHSLFKYETNSIY